MTGKGRSRLPGTEMVAVLTLCGLLDSYRWIRPCGAQSMFECTGRESSQRDGRGGWTFGIDLSPIPAVIAGIMVLLLPRLLRWIVGTFLIVWGVLQIP